jgi:hypothetical protein
VIICPSLLCTSCETSQQMLQNFEGTIEGLCLRLEKTLSKS